MPSRTLASPSLVLLAMLAAGPLAHAADSPTSATAATAPAPATRPALVPPLPLWPSDQETISDSMPVFVVAGRPEASAYRVELARSAQFAPEDTQRATEFQLASSRGIAPEVLVPWSGKPLARGRYYWRAFAGDGSGFWTPAANYRVFEVGPPSAELIRPPEELGHPRLLLTGEEMPALLQRIERDDRLRLGKRFLIAAADAALEAEPPDEAYARSGSGQHGYYSAAAIWYGHQLSNVGFAARLTADERYAKAGVRMLLKACAYQRWLGPLFDRTEHFDPPWTSALETAMMTAAVANGYDLLYEYLTEAERQVVRAALVDKGLRPLIRDWVDPISSARIPRHQLPSGNWVMVCTGAAGTASLALLGEHPQAAEWTALCRNRVRAWLADRGGDWSIENPYPSNRPSPIPAVGPSEPNFGRDGSYKESISYMNYAMVYICQFAAPLRRLTGEDLFARMPTNMLDQVAWSVLAWRDESGMRSEMIDFGDCWARAEYPELYAAMMHFRGDRTAAWLSRRLIAAPRTAAALAWHDSNVAEAAPDSSVPLAAFGDAGQAVIRSGWSPNTPVAAIKFHQNRGHLDLGTFVLFGNGGPTIVDSGPTSYANPIYQQYSSRTHAHNVIMVDGQPQLRTDGRMTAAVSTSSLSAVCGQLAAAYPQALESWTRDLIMLPDGLALIFDRLDGRGPHQYDLVLHPEPPFNLGENGQVTVGESPATRLVVDSDLPLQPELQNGYRLHVPRQYVRYRAGQRAEQARFVTLCQWPKPGSNQPLVRITPLGPGRWQITRADAGSRLVVRTGVDCSDRSPADARLCAVWDEGPAATNRQALLLGGKRLSVEGEELLTSDQPLHVAVEFGPPLRAHLVTERPARITLAVGEETEHAFLDGRPIDAVRRRGGLAVEVPAGEHLLQISPIARPLPRVGRLVADDLLALPLPAKWPAFREGVAVNASTFVEPPGLAVDGDVNTYWNTLPGKPMPQWLEVALPAPETLDTVLLDTGSPSSGRVECWDEAANGWRLFSAFSTTPDAAGPATLAGPPTTTQRLRVTIEQISAGIDLATIRHLEWRLAGPAETQPQGWNPG